MPYQIKARQKEVVYIKKMFLAVAILVSLLAFCSCAGSSAQAAQKYPLQIFKENENGRVTTYSLQDDNTDVYYVVVVVESSYGDRNRSVAICPRYNADGTLYTGPYFKN